MKYEITRFIFVIALFYLKEGRGRGRRVPGDAIMDMVANKLDTYWTKAVNILFRLYVC